MNKNTNFLYSHTESKVMSSIIIDNNFKGYSLEELNIPDHYRPYLKNILIPNGLIIDRIEKLAKTIHDDYSGKKLHIICVLKGGDRIFADLNKMLDSLNVAKKSIPITYDFIRTSSYIDNKSSGVVNLMGKLDDLQDRHVLIVEDIIDTGRTLKKLTEEIKKLNPKSLKILALLSKRISKKSSINANYLGFSIPDEFVVGYCLDYNEHFRDLKHICVLNDLGKAEFKK